MTAPATSYRRTVPCLALVVAGLLGGCTSDDSDPGPSSASESTGGPASSSEPPASTPPTEPTAGPTEPTTSEPPDRPEPARFDADAAFAYVRHLADDIGPRHGTSPEFERAADWVDRRLTRLGYDVRSQRFRAPAGNSWGIDVPAGRSRNVIATPPGFDPGKPHLIVGAHLDTVPQAPGAEDNASGVSVVLELARMTAEQPARLPVVFVAFGSEEPRGEGDALHHFGSTAFVARMAADQRRALVAMVSLDRVGVGAGAVVPVSAGGLEPPDVRTQLVKAGNRVDVETVAELNQSSDHWSFDKAGLPAARVGSTPYAGYHSAGDVPGVVNPAQLKRVGTLMWEWIRSS